MLEVFYWAVVLISATICTGTGLLAWKKSHGQIGARIFFVATITTSISMICARITITVGTSNELVALTSSKFFLTFLLLSLSFFWQLSIFFPVEREVRFRPPNLFGIAIIASLAGSLVFGSIAEPDFDSIVGTTVASGMSAIVMVICFVTMAVLASLLTYSVRKKASKDVLHSAVIYVIGGWIVAVSGVVFSADMVLGHRHPSQFEPVPRAVLVVAITGVMLYFSSLMVRGRFIFSVEPVTERLASAAKAKYNLLLRRVYLVEEAKPDFSLKLFADILKGRCYDCEDDQSFPCESLDCGACALPCPCKKCKKYPSRIQGLIVTRLYPKEVRKRLYLQTTPVLWLSTVPGRDNMDPAKLSLLTDFLVVSMEKSQNVVVLVDGIEYLITSNDFVRVLRSIDRWAETAMTSSARLIITLDPNAFDERELAMLERNKEVVRPGAKEAWRVIPEPI